MVEQQIKWMGVEQLFKMQSIAAVMKNYTVNKNVTVNENYTVNENDTINKNDTVNDTVNETMPKILTLIFFN